MNWKYDAKHRIWYNDRWEIQAPGNASNDSKLYELQRGWQYVARFHKLKSAKEVAHLMEVGHE